MTVGNISWSISTKGCLTWGDQTRDLLIISGSRSQLSLQGAFEEYTLLLLPYEAVDIPWQTQIKVKEQYDQD